jgi:hypothetical protein
MLAVAPAALVALVKLAVLVVAPAALVALVKLAVLVVLAMLAVGVDMPCPLVVA